MVFLSYILLLSCYFQLINQEKIYNLHYRTRICHFGKSIGKNLTDFELLFILGYIKVFYAIEKSVCAKICSNTYNCYKFKAKYFDCLLFIKGNKSKTFCSHNPTEIFEERKLSRIGQQISSV